MNPNEWPFYGYLQEVALRIVKGEHTSTDVRILLAHSEEMRFILPEVRQHYEWANLVTKNTDQKSSQ